MVAKKTKVKTETVTKPDNRKLLIRAAVAIGLLGLLFYFKNWLVVAWVNNQPISRLSYMSEVDRMAGEQAFNTLITKRLILQEAQIRQVSVTAEELDAEMQTIEGIAKQQNMSLDELLADQGLNREVLLEEVRIQKLLEKMAGDPQVTSEEIQAYWEENQTLYPDQTLEEVTPQLTTQLKQQKISQAVQTLISELQQQAKIVRWL